MWWRLEEIHRREMRHATIWHKYTHIRVPWVMLKITVVSSVERVRTVSSERR